MPGQTPRKSSTTGDNAEANGPAALVGNLVRRSELSPLQQDAMFALFSTYFEGVLGDVFHRDLAEKNWVILLEDQAGNLCGFTTLFMLATSYNDKQVGVVYSGDTIVATEARGTATLPRTWIRSVNRLRGNYDLETVYWLLITSGYRTYRFLPVFWREFYPRYDRPTPHRFQDMLDHFATDRYGEDYDRRLGVVRFKHPQVVRGDLGGIEPRRMTNPHVAFFAKRNPGYMRGDELACITELSPDNLTAAGRRMVHGTGGSTKRR